MRILMVTNGFPPVASAGVESHTHALALELVKAGHSVHIFCRDADFTQEMYAVREMDVDGLPVTRVVNNLTDAYDFTSLYRNPRIDAIYARVLTDFAPDVVHVQHCIGLSVGCLEQSLDAGIPTVLSLHDYWYICPTVALIRPDKSLCAGPHHGMNCFDCVYLAPKVTASAARLSFLERLAPFVPVPVRRWVWSWLSARQNASVAADTQHSLITTRIEAMRALMGRAHLIVAPSQHLKARYVEYGIAEEKIRAVPLGMNVEQWVHVPRPPRPAAAPLRFGFAGSLVHNKGAHIAVEAFMQTQGNMTLEIAGFEPLGSRYVSRLKEMIAREPRITFSGTIPNHEMAARFASWDALLMPVQWEETFSFVAREALLTGLPVIASDLPVLPEIIRHGENGYLLPPGDVEAWAAHFRALLADPDALRTLNPRADRSFARTFADHAQEQIRIYEEVRATRTAPKVVAR